MNNYATSINAFHIFVVAPFLIYLALEGPLGRVPQFVYTLLLYVALGLAAYHAYVWYTRTQVRTKVKKAIKARRRRKR